MVYLEIGCREGDFELFDFWICSFIMFIGLSKVSWPMEGLLLEKERGVFVYVRVEGDYDIRSALLPALTKEDASLW